jgi:hypothetical protein
MNQIVYDSDYFQLAIVKWPRKVADRQETVASVRVHDNGVTLARACRLFRWRNRCGIRAAKRNRSRSCDCTLGTLHRSRRQLAYIFHQTQWRGDVRVSVAPSQEIKDHEAPRLRRSLARTTNEEKINVIVTRWILSVRTFWSRSAVPEICVLNIGPSPAAPSLSLSFPLFGPLANIFC